MKEEVSKITDIEYNDNDYEDMIRDLIKAYWDLKIEYEEYQEDIDENYVFNHKNPYSEYGLNERNF